MDSFRAGSSGISSRRCNYEIKDKSGRVLIPRERELSRFPGRNFKIDAKLMRARALKNQAARSTSPPAAASFRMFNKTGVILIDRPEGINAPPAETAGSFEYVNTRLLQSLADCVSLRG